MAGDGYTAYHQEKLWKLLPGLYRTLDLPDGSGPLREMVDRATSAGWRLVNADCTIVAERPRIAPFREEMMTSLSAAAGASVHVKATRPEGLGSLGRVEGVACMAVALVEEVSPGEVGES